MANWRPTTRLAVLIAIIMPAPASAMTLTLDDGTPRPQPYQGWLDAAKVPLPPVDVTLHLASCPDQPQRSACAAPGEVWLDPQRDMTPRQTFLHEVGHQFDYSVMTDEARAVVQFVRGDRRAWRQPPNSPHERFADAWMHCALRPTIRHRWENIAYDYSPSPTVHRDLCLVIWWAAAGDFGRP